MSIVADEKTAAMFDLVMFCTAMDAAARKWYADQHNNRTVSDNLDHLIRGYCPFGLSPFLGGEPVVGSGP